MNAEKNNPKNLKKETKFFIDIKYGNNSSTSNSQMAKSKHESSELKLNNKIDPRKPSFFDVESYTTLSESSNQQSKSSKSTSIYNSETDNRITLEDKSIKKR